MYRWLRPRKLILAYFAAFLFAFVWLIQNIETFCPEKKSHRPRDNIYEEEFKLLDKREKELKQIEKKLTLAEMHLKKLFPDKIGHILEMFESNIPMIYAITPTYSRPVQKAELTRLMNTFINVPNFWWIVVEDADRKSDLVTNLLRNSGLKYTHLNQPTPSDMKLQSTDPNWLKPRGVLQRNEGLEWLRKNIDPDNANGVVYFADDDNTYDTRIFEEMRFTTKVSVWPVGLVGYLRYERPIVSNKKVVGWFTAWKPERPFATDMAGFAVNLKLFFEHPKAKFGNLVKRGELESNLIGKLSITMNDLEPKAEGCTKVLVWHTRTENPSLKNEDKLKAAGKGGSNPNVEV